MPSGYIQDPFKSSWIHFRTGLIHFNPIGFTLIQFDLLQFGTFFHVDPLKSILIRLD
jgi:hypothetical protein